MRPGPIRPSSVIPSIIGVACPFCTIMFEDGLKAREKDETVKVLDVAELLALSVDLKE